MRHSRLFGALAVSAVLGLAACGTRLPDSAFTSPPQPVAGSTAGPGASPSSSAAANTESDVGVTPTTITIGQIASSTNPFDPQAFDGPVYGLQAFVNYTNAHGGVNGRKLVLKTCDDQGSSIANTTCAHTLIDQDHVFALVSNVALDYAGAGYVNSKNVPDIGGQPIDNAYNTYRNLYDIYGETYPRNGQVGLHGRLYAGTEVYRFFKVRFPHVPLKAGVVEFNQSDSERFGNSIVEGLRLEGYTVNVKVVNFTLPDFNTVAISFKHTGVQYVYDALDSAANVRLCQALDQNNVTLTAKVLTTQAWNQTVNSDYASAPKCRNELWVTGNTRNYADTRYHQVALFRQQMSADGDGGAKQLSDWALEGWAGGLWFSDAARSCGADLTRVCVETYMNRAQPYDGHGLLTPRKFTELSVEPPIIRDCINVARWVSAKDAWVTQVPDMDTNCFRVKNFSYPAD